MSGVEGSSTQDKFLLPSESPARGLSTQQTAWPCRCAWGASCAVALLLLRVRGLGCSCLWALGRFVGSSLDTARATRLFTCTGGISGFVQMQGTSTRAFACLLACLSQEDCGAVDSCGTPAVSCPLSASSLRLVFSSCLLFVVSSFPSVFRMFLDILLLLILAEWVALSHCLFVFPVWRAFLLFLFLSVFRHSFCTSLVCSSPSPLASFSSFAPTPR